MNDCGLRYKLTAKYEHPVMDGPARRRLVRAIDHGTPLFELEKRFGRCSQELKRIYLKETSALA